MGWLARNAQKRVDPNLVLPGARSVVSLACAYGEGNQYSVISNQSQDSLPSTDPLITNSPTGLVALRPSCGLPRHPRQPLKQLAEFID